MRADSCRYEYQLDDRFFADIDAPGIRKGKLHADLEVTKQRGLYELDFHITGSVVVPCDRCLDELEMPVDTENHLEVKLGNLFADEDDVVTVPEEEGFISVAWFMYEFIVLSLPMQRVHAPGQCNEQMMECLDEHLCVEADDADDTDDTDADDAGDESPAKEIDPRWNELKKILNNN